MVTLPVAAASDDEAPVHGWRYGYTGLDVSVQGTDLGVGSMVLLEGPPLEPPAPPRRVALLGRAASTRADIPLDGSVEVWGLNRPAIDIRPDQVSAWFEMHTPAIWRGSPNAETYITWLQSLPVGTPVYMREHFPEIPASVPYPFERVYAAFPRRYFTSTMAYMLALAILDLHPGDEVQTYGISMAGNEEYAYQRACFEYYLGQAEGRGITVTLPEATGVLRGILYGWADPENPFRTRVTLQAELRRRHLNVEHGRLAAAMNFANGQIQAISDHGTDEQRAELLPPLKKQQAETGAAMERARSAIDTLSWVLAQADDLRDLVRVQPHLQKLVG